MVLPPDKGTSNKSDISKFQTVRKTADSVTFNEEIPNGNLYFLRSESSQKYMKELLKTCR